MAAERYASDMSFRIGKIDFKVSPLYFIITAFCFIIDSSGVMPTVVLSSILHEAAHIAAMSILRLPPLKIEIMPYGMLLEAPPSSELSELGVAAAGPASNALAAFASAVIFSKHESETAALFFLVNAIIAAVNLLPVAGLDGGDICLCLLSRFLGRERGRRSFSVISYIFSLFAVFCGIILLSSSGNPTAAIVGVYLLILNLCKIPLK